MKKKIISILCLVLVCTTLTGCGLKSKIKEYVKSELEEEVEKVEDQVNDNDNSETEDEIKLYSDNTKYVFELGNIKHVFYYKGDKITGQHTYIDYNDNDTAKMAEKMLNFDDLENVEKHYVKGKYLVIEYNKNAYENLTVQDVKEAYSYMEEVTKS